MTALSTRCLFAFVLASMLLSASAQTSAASAPQPAPLVVIDPGHGGRYSNANANGLREKTVNLAVARELRTALRARGYRVLMTRYSDRAVRLSNTRTWNYSYSRSLWSYMSDGRRGTVRGIPKDDLQARVDYANRRGADLFISIHSNGSPNRSSRGTETYASPKDYLGRTLAPVVNREIVRATRLRNRGSRTADFFVCRWTDMPAILVETAFISNRRDAALLKKSWFRRRLATGIAVGVDKWMNTAPYRRVYSRITASTSAELANAVSSNDFPSGAPAAVVARADRAADVPGAAGLAARLGGPLLWTGPSGPTTSTALELKRLAPETLVFTGVDGTFDSDTISSLARASGIATAAVEVISGADASSVSASIATRMGFGPTGDVLVVDANDRFSKMVAAAASASRSIPLLLASNDTSLGVSVSGWLEANRPLIRNSVVVGRAARAPSVLGAQLPGLYRIDGPDYAYNARRLNARYFTSGRRGSVRPVITTICSNVHYLVAATHAARAGEPLAPVWGRKLPAYTRLWITNRREAIGGFEILTNGSIPDLMDRALAKSDAL